MLRPGGRIAGYVIHAPAGLAEQDALLAAEWGPSEVLAEVSYRDMLEEVGLRVLLAEDVTASFRATCEAILSARRELEEELLARVGAQTYAEDTEQKRLMLRGVEEGLLRRSLLVACRS